MRTEEAKKLINRFMAGGEDRYIFACHAAVPLVLTPDLLFQLWNNFRQYQYEFEPGVFYRMSHIVVSDLLQSPLCRKVGTGMYEMEKEIRELLLTYLTENLGEKRKLTIAAFLRDYSYTEQQNSYRRSLKDIHYLTAQSILNPVEMEKQIVQYINQAQTEAEKLNYLLLHKDLLPVGFESEIAQISNNIDVKDGQLAPILVREENVSALSVLQMKLPAALKGRVKRLKVTQAADTVTQINEQALQLVAACIRNKDTKLDLGNCGLTDADFIAGSELDIVLRKCTHITSLVLSNSYRGYLQSEQVENTIVHSANEGVKNILGIIPPALEVLENLTTFICAGEPEAPWLIESAELVAPANLLYADLRFNKITTANFNHLQKLLYLWLGHNNIKEAGVFTQLPNLRVLDLTYNNINDLRPLLPLLQRSYQPLAISMDEEPYTGASNLLHLFGNPFTNPPASMLQYDLATILEYFEEYDKSNDLRSALIKEKSKWLARIHLQTDDMLTRFSTGCVVWGTALNPGLGDELFLLADLSVLLDNSLPARTRKERETAEIAWEFEMPEISKNELYETQGILYADKESGIAVFRLTPKSHEHLYNVLKQVPAPAIVDVDLPNNLDELIVLYCDGWAGKLTITPFTESEKILAGGNASSSFVFTQQMDLVAMKQIHISAQANEVTAGTIVSIKRFLESFSRYWSLEELNIYLSLPYSVSRFGFINDVLNNYTGKMRTAGYELKWKTSFDTVAQTTKEPVDLLVADALKDCHVCIIVTDGEPAMFQQDEITVIASLYEGQLLSRVLAIQDVNSESFNTKSQLIDDFVYYEDIEDLEHTIESYLDFIVQPGAGHFEKNKERFTEHYIPPGIQELAAAYDKLRETMPSGNARTERMIEIAGEMRKWADEIYTMLSILINSEKAGERLAALVGLEVHPDISYMEWVVNAIGDSEKPFIGARATVTFYNMADAFIDEHENMVRLMYKKAVANLEVSRFKDPNQVHNIGLVEKMLPRKGNFLTRFAKSIFQDNSQQNRLEGKWSGFYMQNNERTDFIMQLWFINDRLDFWGVMNENGNLGKSDISGSFGDKKGLDIFFQKRYRNRPGYTIMYEGRGNYKTLGGTWVIEGQAKDEFELWKAGESYVLTEMQYKE